MSERKQLTLEELRKMDGKPVFGVSLITDKPGEWFICRVVEMSKVWFIACAGANQGFGDKDTYGKTWIAYATEPPCLDRSAWEPCEFCGKADFGEFGFEISKHYAKIVCALGSWRFPKNERFNFCPKCGRPLTDAAWDMLERRMLGSEQQ